MCLEKEIIRPAVERDHRVPLFMGGADDESNEAGLCAECHLAKTIAERAK
jgi:5-methylcytosine-specific restriction protein A